MDYSVGFEQWMAATVQFAPFRGPPRFPSLLTLLPSITSVISCLSWEIGPLCYNESQRYCHGLLVTR